MKPIRPALIDDVIRESELFDIYQTARKLIVLESSINVQIEDGIDPDFYKRFFTLCQSDINLHLLPVFCRELLKYCLDAKPTQLTADDYPLDKILEYCQEHGSFSPEADRKEINDPCPIHSHTLTQFCKVIAFRGFAHWDDRNQVLTMQKPPGDPDDYDYQWLHL